MKISGAVVDFQAKSAIAPYFYVKISDMFKRVIQLDDNLDQSIFLFGARQTGKSTVLRERLKHAVIYDLLDSDIRARLAKRPALLYETHKDDQSGRIIVIDQIQEVPQLLNEIHRLITEKHLIFVLCGSSARKIKRKGYNTLGGRAFPKYLFPLTSAEIPDLDIDKAVNTGLLPEHYLSKNAWQRLSGYIDIYMKEEIQQEAIVRNLTNFERFLEVAAITDGEIVNYNNIASDCGISASTVKEYFGILQDTLIGYMIPSFSKTVKRKLAQAPRFYYFDIGVANYLLHRKDLVRGTPGYGHAFEHLVIQELIAWLSYTSSDKKLSYWRTYTGIEVDAVIGDEVAIEIKSVEEVLPKHLKGLKAFAEEHPDAKKIIVSLDRFSRKIGDIECFYFSDFFNRLWNNQIV